MSALIAVDGYSPSPGDETLDFLAGQGIAAVSEADQHVGHPVNLDAVVFFWPFQPVDYFAYDATRFIFFNSQSGFESCYDLSG